MTATEPGPDLESAARPRGGVVDDPAAGPAGMTGLSTTADGARVPTAWQRARRLDLGDPLVGWLATIAVTLLALFLRLWHLGKPREFSFDETYYAKDAYALWHFGYVRDATDKANELILAPGFTDGSTDGLYKESPSLVAHPEVGKWIIGLGEHLFGMDPFGWRVMSAVVGALMIMVMIRFARRLTGSTLLGLVAGLLLSLDGLQLVLSRLALLDIFVAFFLLCGVYCVVLDREWFRRRLARLTPDQVLDSSTFGPVRGVLVRPWLIAAGVWFGLGVGTKWTLLYPLAAFGLLAWIWSASGRKAFGVSFAWAKSALVDGVPAFVQLIGVALVTYVLSWTGWMVHADQYEEALSNTQYTQYDGGKQWPTATEPDASGPGEVVQSLRSLWYFHQDVYTFHTKFLNDSEHTYQSKPIGWPILNRPVGVNADNDIKPGEQGCEAASDSTCMRQVLLLGNPVIWWGGCLALIASVVLWAGRRDWRFGVAVVGTLSTWLPWLQYDDRPIFLFYAITILPFMVLAITLVIGKLLGAASTSPGRRTTGVIVAGSFFMLALLCFVWFWPIWTDQLITQKEWGQRIWFQRWV